MIEDNQSPNSLSDETDTSVVGIGNNDWIFLIVIGVICCCVCGIISWFIFCKKEKEPQQTTQTQKMGELRRIKSDTPGSPISTCTVPMTPTMTMNETDIEVTSAELKPMKSISIMVSVDPRPSTSGVFPSTDNVSNADDSDGNDDDELNALYLGGNSKTKGDAEYDNVPKLPEDDLLNEDEDEDEDDDGNNDLYIADNPGLVTPQASYEGYAETNGYDNVSYDDEEKDDEKDEDEDEDDAMYVNKETNL